MTIQEQIANFKGSQIIGLDTVTQVKLNGGKKNPMQNKVTKITKGSVVMLFTSSKGYKNMVRRRLREQKEGDITTMEIFETITSKEFEPGPRQWGKRIEGTPFVEHKDKTYLECIFIKPGSSTYFLDGKEICKEDIIGLQEKNEGEQGGLKDKVILRTFALDSIIGIRKAGQLIPGPASTD
jgi:hypothetical protein